MKVCCSNRILNCHSVDGLTDSSVMKRRTHGGVISHALLSTELALCYSSLLSSLFVTPFPR